MRKTSGNLADEGSGTILALGLIFALVSVATVLITYSNQCVEQVQLDSETDNAAVAAADALRGLVVGYPCDVARTIAPISSCEINGNDVLIVSARHGLVARARAGEPG